MDEGGDYGDWSRWWLSGTYWCRWWPIFSRCHRNYQVMGVLAGTPGHLVNMVNTHSSSFGHLGKPSREFLGTVWNTRCYLESYDHHLTSKRQFCIPLPNFMDQEMKCLSQIRHSFLNDWQNWNAIIYSVFNKYMFYHSLPMSVTHWLTNDLVEDWMKWPKHAEYAEYAE